MGSKSSKKTDGPKSQKLEERNQKNNSRRYDSTQSLNIDHSDVFSNPDPNFPNARSQPESRHTLPKYDSTEDVSGRRGPAFQPPPPPTQSYPRNQEHRMKTQSQVNSFEETSRQANPSIPPRSKSPPVPNTKETLTRRKDSTDSKPKLRADRNYEAIHKSDISFREGDILQLLTDGEVGGGWYYVKNLTTRQEGYVHNDCVSLMTSYDVESQREHRFKMGSIFGKKKDGSKPSKSKKKELKTPNGMNNPQVAGSSQSLNMPHNAVSSSPNPGDAYSQPEDARTLQRYHSAGDLSGHARPVLHSPPNPPPSHPPNQGHHIMQTQHQFHSVENHPDQFKPIVTPRGKPLPVPNREVQDRRHDPPEDNGHYLGENKEQPVYHQIEANKRNADNFYSSPESNSRPKLRADRNYESIHGNDISFRKGDILQLLRDEAENGYNFVKNLTTREEGYVYKDYVSMVTSDDVESQKCFFVGLDREKAEEKLLEPYVELGTYLLRPGADGYVLSLRCENDFYELEIRHYKVRVAEGGICYIEADSNRKPFSNITDLIKYYSEKPGLRCKLKKPLPHDVQLNDLAVRFSDLKLGEKLGSGNFASVYAGTMSNNRQVAVKSLKFGGSMTVEEFREEAETMHKLRHPNLVSLLGICEENGTIYIITEMMLRGSLQALLRKDYGSTINFEDLMHMAIQVVEGMCYLEREGFVHRDLRAANVLVGDEKITKIADFGLTRLLDRYYEHEDFFQDKKGSVFPYKWTAPESIKQQKFTVKSDVWSFGILLYEIVTYGDEPYPAMSNREVLDWVLKGNRLEKPTDQRCPVTLYNIIKQCWLKHSEDRPNFSNIKETLLEIKAH